MKIVCLLVALFLLGTPAAQASGFRLGGYHASPYMKEWASHSLMPLPPVRISISYGGPGEWGPHSIALPSCCSGGWTHQVIQGLFFHELGHAYDATSMTPSLRQQFRSQVGVPTAWPWFKPIKTVRWVVSDTYFIKIAPSEMFAEEYAACSLGLTQFAYQEAGYNTYGWVPPRGTNETALCSLIASAS